eukprot:jgi/Botrbrau1/5504/Bobra.27_1s0041.1
MANNFLVSKNFDSSSTCWCSLSAKEELRYMKTAEGTHWLAGRGQNSSKISCSEWFVGGIFPQRYECIEGCDRDALCLAHHGPQPGMSSTPQIRNFFAHFMHFFRVKHIFVALQLCRRWVGGGGSRAIATSASVSVLKEGGGVPSCLDVSIRISTRDWRGGGGGSPSHLHVKHPCQYLR